MTRTNREAEKNAADRAQIAAIQKRIAQREAHQRERTQKEINKRRYLIGKSADEEGCPLSWDMPTYRGIFRLLAPLGNISDPVAWLEHRLAKPERVWTMNDTQEEG